MVRRLLAPIAGVLLLSTCALAQSKVAIINLQKALVDTVEIKKAQADLEARYKPRQEQIQKLQKELENIQTQLQTMAGKLTAQAEQDYQIQGQRKQRELQRLTEDLQGDVDRDRTDILSKSGQRMTDIVKKLAEGQGLDVVLDVSNSVYFKPALEITKEATDAYDKAFPVK